MSTITSVDCPTECYLKQLYNKKSNIRQITLKSLMFCRKVMTMIVKP